MNKVLSIFLFMFLCISIASAQSYASYNNMSLNETFTSFTASKWLNTSGATFSGVGSAGAGNVSILSGTLLLATSASSTGAGTLSGTNINGSVTYRVGYADVLNITISGLTSSIPNCAGVASCFSYSYNVIKIGSTVITDNFQLGTGNDTAVANQETIVYNDLAPGTWTAFRIKPTLWAVYKDGTYIRNITAVTGNLTIETRIRAQELSGAGNLNIFQNMQVDNVYINGQIDSEQIDLPIDGFATDGNDINISGTVFSSSVDKKNTTVIIYKSGTLFNVSTQSVTGYGINYTNFSIPNLQTGVYTYALQMCDNFNKCIITNNNTFYRGYILNGATYNATSVTTRTEGYVINFNITSGETINSINFVFNNVSETASYSSTINNVIATSVKTLNTTGTNVFYWSINIGGTIINSSLFTQTVSAISPPLISGASCSGGGYQITYNFSNYDESNLTQIPTTSFGYVIYYGISNGYSLATYGNVSARSLYLCLNYSASPSWIIGYGEIDYQPSSSYPLRKYLIFQNNTLSTYVNNISLYSIDSSTSTTFDLTVLSRSSLLPYSNYYISLLRWYPAFNQYYSVDMGKLDDLGKTPIHVVTEDIDYRIAVYSANGTLIHLASPRRLVCITAPCSYSLSIEEESISLTEFLNIQNDLSYNNNTGVWTFIWNDPSQHTSLMNLTVYREIGNASIPICASSSSAYTGVITCNTSTYSGTLRAIVTRSASPPAVIAQYVVNTVRSLFRSSFGLFISLLIAIPVIFALAYVSPIFAIVVVSVALIPAYYFGAVSFVVVGAVVALGGVILHVLNRI